MEMEIRYCVLEHLPLMPLEYLNLLPLRISIAYGKYGDNAQDSL